MNPDNPNLRTAEMWAEHYDRLRKEYADLKGNYDTMCLLYNDLSKSRDEIVNEFMELKRQNKIMREALEFYGYLDNYFTTRGQQYDSNVEIDSGEKARAVLAEVDKESKSE